MSRAAWIAIIAAIAFPSIALVVVLMMRPAPPPQMQPHMGPPPHGKGPPMPPIVGGPPLPPHGGPPAFEGELIRLRKQLELTDEQVDQVWKIGQPARREMSELSFSIEERELELRELLQRDVVEEEEIAGCLEKLHSLRLRMDTLKVLTPLRLKQVLTDEQRAKLVSIWRDENPRGQAPPRPPSHFGPHGPPPVGPPMKGPPGMPPDLLLPMNAEPDSAQTDGGQ